MPKTSLRLRQHIRERVMPTLRHLLRDSQTVADMIAVRHKFLTFRLDRSAILHRMGTAVSTFSISTYTPFPFLQNLPTIIYVWIVRRSRGRITRLT
jgi:hypothetical protein